MSSTKRGRKLQSASGKVVPATQGSPQSPGRVVDAIASALRREYEGAHAAVKTVAALVGANERAVKNWFDAKNGPSGVLLVALCRHSDAVLETVLLLAGRNDLLTAKKFVDAKGKLRQMLELIEQVEAQ